MKKIKLSFKRISKNFADIQLPHYATDGSSGMDIRATLEQPIIIGSGKVVLVPTNVAVEIPPGYEIQVRPRSGLAAKRGMGLLNSPGTIDADYRGEIKIIMFNFSDKNFTINSGDRIAQLVLAEVIIADISEVAKLGSTVRGDGGFGHTGKN
ncbi:MAG: dUTP diphosphatase [Ignavibacteriae bacterium]|nr:dUTP diphosphatase [Ignavibacteriota bacterium]